MLFNIDDMVIGAALIDYVKRRARRSKPLEGPTQFFYELSESTWKRRHRS
jgi:hypothetical protein